MMKQSTHYPGIDVIKGCLILQVVLTHALGDNNLRFLMYTYHMPLFMSISGFLIKQERLRKLSFGQLIKKYLYRLIIPWTVAFLFYNFIVYYQDIISNNFDMIALIEKIIYPYYHLWFIPALLFMIFCLWVIEKLKISPQRVLLFSFMITIAWFGYFHWENARLMEESLFYKFIGEKRNFIYFSFFFLSYYLKNYRKDLLGKIDSKKLIAFIVIITGALVVSNYIKGNPIRPYYYAFFYLIFNVSIIYYSLSYLITMNFKNRILQFSNNYSMVVYLYHYIILVKLHAWIEPYMGESLLQTTILFTITCIILLPAIKLLSNIPLIDLYVFGNTKRLIEKSSPVQENIQINKTQIVRQ